MTDTQRPTSPDFSPGDTQGEVSAPVDPADPAEAAKLARLSAVIEQHGGARSGLIEVLRHAQTIYGYLPPHLLKVIAARMGLPFSEVAGVVTFYSFFSTVPRGKHVIRVCLGTACYIRGGQELVEHLRESLGVALGGVSADLKFSCDVARCIGACGLAPAVMVDDDVHRQVTPAKLDAIQAAY
ncbi:MAG: NAD(P)H-dependent oxidoreductase subunit E [Bifidobacteriaceae bacterium]|jgi:NADH:ubiquinone oxidoreductase subunit E|nr:NAD(P)H-dependent oxidoreductase subunit E [Bifidobacteriaceae bacterium]